MVRERQTHNDEVAKATRAAAQRAERGRARQIIMQDADKAKKRVPYLNDHGIDVVHDAFLDRLVPQHLSGGASFASAGCAQDENSVRDNCGSTQNEPTPCIHKIEPVIG